MLPDVFITNNDTRFFRPKPKADALFAHPSPNLIHTTMHSCTNRGVATSSTHLKLPEFFITFQIINARVGVTLTANSNTNDDNSDDDDEDERRTTNDEHWRRRRRRRRRRRQRWPARSTTFLFLDWSVPAIHRRGVGYTLTVISLIDTFIAYFDTLKYPYMTIPLF